MRRFRRARRPLIALVALVLALAIGYAVKGCDGSGRSDDSSGARVGDHASAGLTHTGGRVSRPSAR